MPGTKMFRAWPSTTACAEIPRAKSKKMTGPRPGAASLVPDRSTRGGGWVNGLLPSGPGCRCGAAGTQAGRGDAGLRDTDHDHRCAPVTTFRDSSRRTATQATAGTGTPDVLRRQLVLLPPVGRGRRKPRGGVSSSRSSRAPPPRRGPGPSGVRAVEHGSETPRANRSVAHGAAEPAGRRRTAAARAAAATAPAPRRPAARRCSSSPSRSAACRRRARARSTASTSTSEPRDARRQRSSRRSANAAS